MGEVIKTKEWPIPYKAPFKPVVFEGEMVGEELQRRIHRQLPGLKGFLTLSQLF